MQFSEDDLRAALRRKDPGEAFTESVMARVSQPQARVTSTSKAGTQLRELWRRLWPRPALTGAVAGMVIAGGLLGFGHYRAVRERRTGEVAKQQALLALRITNAKLNHVIERVRIAQAP